MSHQEPRFTHQFTENAVFHDRAHDWRIYSKERIIEKVQVSIGVDRPSKEAARPLPATQSDFPLGDQRECSFEECLI